MGHYNEDDIIRETYGGVPKGWSAKEYSNAPTNQAWQKPEHIAPQVDDAQFTAGLSAPGIRSPHST